MYKAVAVVSLAVALVYAAMCPCEPFAACHRNVILGSIGTAFAATLFAKKT